MLARPFGMTIPALVPVPPKPSSGPAEILHPHLRVVPSESFNPWTTGFRVPNPKLAKKFRRAAAELEQYARSQGLALGWFTLTSRSRGSDARVLEDLKRAWDAARHRAAFRKLPGFLVVFATHSRPHAHLLAIMPPGLSLRAVRSAWRAGITGGRRLRDAGDAEGVGTYCAAQDGDEISNSPFRFRSFSYRAPPAAHLDWRPPVAAPALHVVPPPPIPCLRADAGGGPAFGERANEGGSAARRHLPQAGVGRPQAGGVATLPEAHRELNNGPPPCMSEHPNLHLVPSPSDKERPLFLPGNPYVRSDDFSNNEIEIAMAHLRRFIPRDRDAAIGIGSLVSLADLQLGVVDEALMRLLYAGHVKRRRDRKVFVYWAGKTMPPPLAVPLDPPQRLRHFMPPPNWLRT